MTKLLIVTPDGRTVDYRDLDYDGRLDVDIALHALHSDIEDYQVEQDRDETEESVTELLARYAGTE